MSLSVSPLDTLEPFAANPITSADSRFAASSKLVLVRVESSKNSVTTVRPRRVGSLPTLELASTALQLGGGVEHQGGVVAGSGRLR